MAQPLLRADPRHYPVIGAGLASGQDQKTAVTNAPPPPKSPWDTTAAAGLTLTRGNSDTMLATLSLDSKRKSERNEAAFGATGGYGENKNVRNADFATAYAQYNRLFTDRFYGGLRVSFNYDAIADLSYRVTVGPLAGYYLIKSTNTTLSVEAGPSIVFEKVQQRGPGQLLRGSSGEHFDQKLTATTRIWEDLSYVPKVDDWSEKYIITGEVGIDAAINKHWSLRIVLQDIYDSLPAVGREHNDMRLIAGTAYKFSRRAASTPHRPEAPQQSDATTHSPVPVGRGKLLGLGQRVPRRRQRERPGQRLGLKALEDDFRRRPGRAAGRCHHRAWGRLSRAHRPAARGHIRQEAHRLSGGAGREGGDQGLRGRHQLGEGPGGYAGRQTLPNAFFGGFNPYSDLIHGDWFNPKGRAASHRRRVSQRRVADRGGQAGGRPETRGREPALVRPGGQGRHDDLGAVQGR